MKKIKKFEKAKFFCESCGAEVSQNARVCTNCGKFFSAVRCPHCGRVGKTEEFIHGCPECGYAVSPSQSFYPSDRKSSSSNKKRNSNFSISSIFGVKKNKAAYESKLPVWIYIVCLLVLLFLVIAMYSCLR